MGQRFGRRLRGKWQQVFCGKLNAIYAVGTIAQPMSFFFLFQVDDGRCSGSDINWFKRTYEICVTDQTDAMINFKVVIDKSRKSVYENLRYV